MGEGGDPELINQYPLFQGGLFEVRAVVDRRSVDKKF